MNGEEKRLCEIKVGESCVIRGLLTEGVIRRRLLDLGFAPGCEVECIGVSPLGDPCAYLVCSTVIALRRRDGIKIVVE